MPFESGHKKHGGRKKGDPNKRTMHFKTAQEACAARGFDPMETWVELSLDPDKMIKIQALKELSKYMYVQKRSVELTGSDNGPIKVQEIHPAVAEFKDLVKTLVDAKVKS